jgi:hydroxymethylbilane synthase
LSVELVGFVTKGDRHLEKPLTEIGVQGLFVKELQRAMLSGEADLAVHSIKDMPFDVVDGLMIAAICERADPRDCLVANQYPNLQSLPAGAVVGTTSLRRQYQLLEKRPDLVVKSVRGNVGTRLSKLDAGEYDALILAAAGLQRLGFEGRITEYFSVETMIPAAGQGALGLECRSDDLQTQLLLQALNHPATHRCVSEEREVNRRLGGGCHMPIAAHATLENERLMIAVMAESRSKKLVYHVAESVAALLPVLAAANVEVVGVD